MQGTYKKFDKDLYEENNHAALARVIQHVSELGLFASLNDDKYGPDLVLYNGYKAVSYIEVERKRGWTTSEEDRKTGGKLGFPFDTVQLPERKGKFLRKRLPMEFWILNSTMDAAIIIPDFVLSSSSLVEVRNTQVEAGELFYKVPVSDCIIKEL